MKTRVRVCKNKPHTLSIERTGEQYQQLELQFLLPHVKYGDERYLDVAFSITWQASETNPEWYAMQFSCHTENLYHIEEMVKCARKVYNASLGSNEKTPETIMGILGSEQCIYDNGKFVPISYSGGKCYRLMNANKCFAVIHALYEKEAYDIANRITGKDILSEPNWSIEMLYELRFEPVSLKSDFL